MGRGKKNPAGQRGGNSRPRQHAVRGGDDGRWDREYPEDDPFHDLRPDEDDQRNPANDDYIWPDTSDEYEDDD